MSFHIAALVIACSIFYFNTLEYSIFNVIVTGLIAFAGMSLITELVKFYVKDCAVLLLDRPVDASGVPRSEHDKKRFATYPFNHKHANTWYQLCDAKELDDGESNPVAKQSIITSVSIISPVTLTSSRVQVEWLKCALWTRSSRCGGRQTAPRCAKTPFACIWEPIWRSVARYTPTVNFYFVLYYIIYVYN